MPALPLQSYQAKPKALHLADVYPKDQAIRLITDFYNPPPSPYVHCLENRSPERIRQGHIKDAYEQGYQNYLAQVGHAGNVEDSNQRLQASHQRLQNIKRDKADSPKRAYEADNDFRKEAGLVSREIALSRKELEYRKKYNIPTTLYSSETRKEMNQEKEAVEGAKAKITTFKTSVEDYEKLIQRNADMIKRFHQEHIPVRDRFRFSKKELKREQKQDTGSGIKYSTIDNLRMRHHQAKTESKPFRLI